MQPLHVLDTWIECVNEKDLEGILRLYRSDCELVPTFSPRSFIGPDEIRVYFEQLAARSQAGVELHADTTYAVPVTEDTTVLSGLYDFRFEVGRELRVFPSRFTFVVSSRGTAPIVHHHSSAVPEPPA